MGVGYFADHLMVKSKADKTGFNKRKNVKINFNAIR